MIDAAARLIRANGLVFACDEMGHGDDVALLLHGFPEARQAWRLQMPALAGFGWRAVAPDLRGYGETSRPEGRDAYRLDHLVEDAAALFEALGARRRLLVGHDWGGIIAWHAAAWGRIALDGLVILNAPHPQVFAQAIRSGWRQRLRSWYALAFQAPVLPELAITARGAALLPAAMRRQFPGFPEDLLRLYRRNLRQPGAATAMLDYYRANVAELADPVADAPIAVPTLMIWGMDDSALDGSLTRGVERYAGDLRVQRLPGVSHWVQHEAAEAVNAAIGGWTADKGLRG